MPWHSAAVADDPELHDFPDAFLNMVQHELAYTVEKDDRIERKDGKCVDGNKKRGR